ncbi:BsuPI-related putative proteinase inhibitor [Litchfieldia alkalitelluris]|uniref:BsuPI-related putative proteinase inhibitor n=1 Tax=Litchfieldia alkalitelluris TaxID=304268 RepID=UPI000997B5E1|nr:BsuPI-related putative proteinase inhibitor [Litchfieldia alkalitelluris]
MKNYYVFVVLVLLLTGCGSQNQKVDIVDQVDISNGGIVAGEVESSIIEKTPHIYEYRLKNQTEQMVEFKFNTSQRFDYTVQTKDAKGIFRLSDSNSYKSEITTETIKQGEELIYEINLTELDLKSGEYLLSVWMTTDVGEEYKIVIDIII